MPTVDDISGFELKERVDTTSTMSQQDLHIKSVDMYTKW